MSTHASTALADVTVTRWYDGLLESGLVPDVLIRAGIRRICASRLEEQHLGGISAQHRRFEAFVEQCSSGPIAVHTDAANAQHYEVPADFFTLALGPHMKYSSGLWTPDITNLEQAERAMLELTCARAALVDGQQVLELGCGWGSLTLFMAERFPHSIITAVSNSSSQKAFIEATARARGLSNVTVITADIRQFDWPAASVDRVVSVEMFEHLRNHRTLFTRIARWLRADGSLFVHIFAHRQFAYPYDVQDSSDWMAQYFFTGGIMPSVGFLPRMQQSLLLERQWVEDGTHYARTADAWLANLDARRAEVDVVLARIYGQANVVRWRERWRIFFMACAELFRYHDGQEWVVAHYRFQQRDQS